VPRPIWSGAISFGLISIPIRLFPAVRKKNVSFNQIDSETGSRVKMKRVSAETGEEVAYDDIVKGYEVTKGNYVVITDEEMSSLDPKKSRTIDIVEFVQLSEIDPVYFDSAYVIAPDELSAKAYAVLEQAMESAGMVAIASFVMRTKQYLCAVRAADGKLLLSTMVYGDEVADFNEIEAFEHLEDVEVKPAELAMAEQLIESLTEPFEPTKFEDDYRQRVLDLIQAKVDGEELAPIEDEEPTAQVIDLAAALEASVAAAKAARERHPTATVDADSVSGPRSAAKKAKKSAAKKATPKKAAKQAAATTADEKKAAKKAATRKSA
jgi:DNA end-binding protein Ku